ncbi:MAG: hypothetical protein ACYTFW_24840 [Planctomycetota bacterium]
MNIGNGDAWPGTGEGASFTCYGSNPFSAERNFDGLISRHTNCNEIASGMEHNYVTLGRPVDLSN